jgi:branched-chain amino acid transport system permease protein
MEKFVISLLSGISYGMVLFLVAAGLSLIFGFMGILNLAHGVVFMLGGYIGITLAKATGSFIYGVLAGTFAGGLIGLIIERGFLRSLYKKVLEQVLVTFGFVYIITNMTLWIWGAWPKSAVVPSLLAGYISTGEYHFPICRLAIILIGALICLGLWWLQEKTKIGAIIRAGMDDAQMVGGLGINLAPITIAAFCLGSALAGFAAVVGALVLGFVNPDTGTNTLFTALAVVIIGGVGSVQGTLAGGLVVGIMNALVTTYFPEFALFTTYILMVLILLFMPRGLLARKT